VKALSAAATAEKVDEAAKLLKNASWARTCARHQEASLLSRLEGQLVEHQRALKDRADRCSRVQISGMGNLLRAENSRYTCGDPAQLASAVISGVELMKVVLDDQEELDRNFKVYSAIIVGQEGEDLVLFKSWNSERAAVAILQQAIRMQKKAISAGAAGAMKQFSREVAAVRTKTARAFLSAFALLLDSVESERCLTEGLEPDEVCLLRPRPFPAEILSDSAVQWLLSAAAEGMIRSEEIGRLRLETVASVSD